MSLIDPLLHDIASILTGERGFRQEALRDSLFVPLFERLGYSAERIQDHAAGESGIDLLVTDRAGEPLVSVGCRPLTSRGLKPFRPFLHDGLMRSSKSPLGLIADGEHLELWESRGRNRVMLAAWPPSRPEQGQRVARELSYLEESLQGRLRGDDFPRTCDPREAGARPDFERHVRLLGSFVRWDLAARYGGIITVLREGGTILPEQEEAAARIKDAYREWAGPHENGFDRFLDALVRVAVRRLFGGLVLEARESRHGDLKRPKGKGGTALQSVERLRRHDARLFAGGPFDWYLPEDRVYGAARRMLLPYRLGKVPGRDLLRLVGDDPQEERDSPARLIRKVLPRRLETGLAIGGTDVPHLAELLSLSAEAGGTLPEQWHVRLAGRSALEELPLDLAILGVAPPSSLELLGEEAIAADLVWVDLPRGAADLVEEIPEGSVATVLLVAGDEEPAELAAQLRMIGAARYLVDLTPDPRARRGVRVLLATAEGLAEDEQPDDSIRVLRRISDLPSIGPRKLAAAPLAPAERVLGGDGLLPDLDHDPLTEEVLARAGRSSVPLGEVVELLPGRPLEEARQAASDAPVPDAYRAIARGRALGRFWVRWSGTWWLPPEGMADPDALSAAGTVLVRRERDRLLAAWDEQGHVPVGDVVKLVPRFDTAMDPRLLVALLNSRWANAFVQREAASNGEASLALLADLPVRVPPLELRALWLDALDGIERANATVIKGLDRLASIDRLAEQAWVTRVPLREASGVLVGYRVPPVLSPGLKPERDGNVVRVGEDFVLRAARPEGARLIVALLEAELGTLENRTGVEIERQFCIPRTDAEAQLLAAAIERARAEVDDAVKRRAQLETQLDQYVLELYELEANDLDLLTWSAAGTGG